MIFILFLNNGAGSSDYPFHQWIHSVSLDFQSLIDTGIKESDMRHTMTFRISAWKNGKANSENDMIFVGDKNGWKSYSPDVNKYLYK